MDCSKRRCAGAGSGAVASLPDDPLLEILSRVPAKSLCRFKCVSKAWRDLVTDPLHRKKLPQTLEGFFFKGLREDLYFVDVLGISVRHVDPRFPFLTGLPGIESIRLLDGSNGLLLFGCIQKSDKSLSYIVSNPATEQWVAVPSSDRGALTYGAMLSSLIFDPAASSHFHLVQIMGVHDLAMVDVYSSKSGVWSPVKSPGDDLYLASSLTSMYCNGMLYVVLWWAEDRTYHIAVMDVEGNTRNMIPAPFRACDEFCQGSNYVGQSQGRLHYIYHAHVWQQDEIPPERQNYDLVIWILEDYETEQWVLKDTVSFLHLFGKRTCQVFEDYNVVAIHPDHNLIFLVQRGNRKLISYNMDSKEVRHLCKLGHGYDYDIIPYVPYFSESSSLENKS